MRHIADIADLKRLAKRRVPRMFYDYADSGSWTEATYRANEADLAKLMFRQRVGIDISRRSLASTMLGAKVAMPLALAPIGLTGMQHADGEILAARAAAAFGIPFCLSTMSICSIEDVAAASSRPIWFQLYMMRDREFIQRLIARAAAAGCSALMVTLDLPMLGIRHKDARNGLSAPPRLTLANCIDLATKLRWCLGMMGTKRRGFGNLIGHADSITDGASLAQWIAEQFDPSLSWSDLAWIRQRWPGKLILKGIMDSDDARRARDCGADAIIVSNHGGRQLDGAPSSIAALPAIAAAVGEDVALWFDGGIRSGQDVLRALACGAQAVMIGRAFLYGLGAMGEAGVTKALEIIARELDLTMGFCGLTEPAQASASILWQRA